MGIVGAHPGLVARAAASAFRISYLTGDSVFVASYLYIGLAGAALTAAWVSSTFIPAERWHQFSIALGIVVQLMFGQWQMATRPHDKSGWRIAAAKIDALQLSPGTPVIVQARS